MNEGESRDVDEKEEGDGVKKGERARGIIKTALWGGRDFLKKKKNQCGRGKEYV